MIGRPNSFAAQMLHNDRMERRTHDSLPFETVLSTSIGAVVVGSLLGLGINEVLAR